ncbi:MAG: ABC transporter ATP-binding protein [Rhodobacteraceae bacterium]|nr:ABC transporter ATP-binding protein [Paracoccaceae bacterium]
MSASILELQDVNKVYRPMRREPVHAVRDFSLTVNRGEIVALLGSSGCGKTSVLRMIAGFEEVSAGAIRLGGRDIHGLAPAKRGVAMAFEGYSLYPPLTLKENIAIALKSQGIGREQYEAKVRTIAQLLEIEDILGRYPSSVSAGQQQRVSLGRALIREAALHLLDEPMGQLEPQLRAVLRGRIKHFIKEQGLTAILVTHDQTEANALADRIAVMEEGRLQQFDTPEEIKARPANLFTGTFIGEPPMNTLNATARLEDNLLKFHLEEDVVLGYPEDAFATGLRDRLLELEQVTIGVRPHAVKLGEQGVSAKVYANQWLGDQSHVAMHFAGSNLISVSHEHVPVVTGATVDIAFPVAELHLFDSRNGTALSHGGDPVEVPPVT